MKKTFKYIAALAASLIAFGCYPEVVEMDQNGLPQASDLKPVVSVNQETNEVTLSIENNDLTAVWIPGDVVIAGKYNGDKVYTGPTTLLFNEKGEHTVELKAYNSYGMTLGSMPVKFTLDNEVAYEKGFAWWDPTEASNLWLTANTTERTFYYAPGWAQIADPTVEEGRYGYIVTLPEATTDQWQAQVCFANLGIATQAGKKYDFQVVLNSSKNHPGVTVKLTQNDDDDVFYCADRHVLNAGTNYIYTLADVDGLDIPNLKLVFDFGGNEAGTVVTIKEIVISEHQANHEPYVVEEGNLWADAKIELSYWFANNDWGQIADPGVEVKGKKYVVTIPDGIGTQQWQGQMVFNNTGLNTTKAKGYQFTMKIKSSADYGNMTIKVTQQDNDDVFLVLAQGGKVNLKAGEEYLFDSEVVAGVDITNVKLVLDFGGAAAGSVVELSGICLREAELPGPDMTILDPDYEGNLWRTEADRGNTELKFFGPGWSPLPAPEFKVDIVKVDTVVVDKDSTFIETLKHTVVIPEGMGPDQWMGQVWFNDLGIKIDPEKVYDFHVVLHSSEDHPNAIVKVAAQNPETLAEGAEIAFLGQGPLKACEDKVFKATKIKKMEAETIALIIDLGGAAVPGSKVIIKDVLIQEHRE